MKIIRKGIGKYFANQNLLDIFAFEFITTQ